MELRPLSFSWPVAILDFEASMMSRISYPIEVGFASWRGLDQPIDSCSTLIRSDLAWVDDGYWSAAVEAVHGIGQKELATGTAAGKVCDRLNAELADCLGCCDSLVYNQDWSTQLCAAGGVRTPYHVESMIKLRRWGNPGFAECLTENAAVVRRALDDAEHLMRAFTYEMKRRPRRAVLP